MKDYSRWINHSELCLLKLCLSRVTEGTPKESSSIYGAVNLYTQSQREKSKSLIWLTVHILWFVIIFLKNSSWYTACWAQWEVFTSPIYRTCSFNTRNYGVLCRCHSRQTPLLVSWVLCARFKFKSFVLSFWFKFFSSVLVNLFMSAGVRATNGRRWYILVATWL